MTQPPRPGLTRAWRLTSEPHTGIHDAFSGEGARRTGRRWNSRGVPVVYASSSVALATLEILVNLEDVQVLERHYVAYRVEIPDRIIARLTHEHLPAGWAITPHGPATKAIGDEWARRGETAALAVPSAVVPLETNYLLNPRHPDFDAIEVHGPVPYPFDERLSRVRD